jgi:hypothetical protein
MKKVFVSAALALAVAGSWAFYPKAAEPGGYMMVVSRFTGTGFGGKNTLSTISPDGQIQTQEADAKSGSINKVANSFDQMHLSELKKINELKLQGWRVVNSTQNSVGNGAITETIYVLDKN